MGKNDLSQEELQQRLRDACESADTVAVRLLLADPRVDPTARNNEAIRMARQNGHADVVRLLLADPRVEPDIKNKGGRKKKRRTSRNNKKVKRRISRE